MKCKYFDVCMNSGKRCHSYCIHSEFCSKLRPVKDHFAPRCNVVLSTHCKNSSSPEICSDCSPYAFDSLLCKFEVKGGDSHG